MLPWNRIAISSVTLLTAFGLSATHGMAQQSTVPATTSDWRVECTTGGKTLDCSALIDVVQRDTHQIITSITVRYPTETKRPVMLVQVPLGILVSEEISIEVDNGQTEHVKVQTCTQAGCFAGSPVSDSLISAMRTGKQLKIVFYNVQKKPVTVTLPLKGFALAYDKIKD